MRIYFQNLSRAKRTAKRFVRMFESMPLSVAQKLAANVYGYADWHELRRVTEKPTHPPSPSDEELDEAALTARLDHQAGVVAKFSGGSLSEARMCITMVAPTARNPPSLGEDPSPSGEPIRAFAPNGAEVAEMADLLRASFDGSIDPMEFIARSSAMLNALPPGMIDKMTAAMASDAARQENFPDATPGAEPLFALLRRKDWVKAKNLLSGSPVFANAYSADGDTATTLAIKGGGVVVLEVLKELAADFNVPDIEGFYPLHEAARTGNVQAVRVLLAGNAEVDPRNPTGWTPLAMTLNTRMGKATETDYAQCAVALLDAGADPTIQHMGGVSAVDLLEHSPMLPQVKQAIQRRAQARASQASADDTILPRNFLELAILMQADAASQNGVRLSPHELARAVAEAPPRTGTNDAYDLIAAHVAPYLESGHRERQQAGRDILETLVRHGSVSATCNLAMSLVRGHGGARDSARAVALLTKLIADASAAPDHIAFAHMILGDVASGSLGEPRDEERAFAHYRAAADLGHPQASFNTALAFEGHFESVIATDPARAAHYYRVAAKGGHTFAKTNLGLLLFEHKHLSESLTEGVDMLLAAEAEGDTNASRAIDFMAREGQREWKRKEAKSQGAVMGDLRRTFNRAAKKRT